MDRVIEIQLLQASTNMQYKHYIKSTNMQYKHYIKSTNMQYKTS
jgi:hypothetical protein